MSIEQILEKLEESCFIVSDFEVEFAYKREEVLRGIRIAYLSALSEYSIWADHVPNGDDLLEKYRKELKQLLDGSKNSTEDTY